MNYAVDHYFTSAGGKQKTFLAAKKFFVCEIKVFVSKKSFICGRQKVFVLFSGGRAVGTATTTAFFAGGVNFKSKRSELIG